jgi:hypothetical protein
MAKPSASTPSSLANGGSGWIGLRRFSSGLPASADKGPAMQWLYVFVIGFVAASMITIIYRFEPNRRLAGALIAIVYLTGTLAILAKLD